MSTTATETIIEFNKFYKYVWLRNFGDGDAYVSNKPNIVVGDDNVIFLPQGQMVMVQALTNKVYVLGETKIEAHAQEFADPPFGGDGASGGGGSAVLITKSVIQNGVYNASSDNADGYKTVNVSVPIDAKSSTITQNGTYNASIDDLAGYSSVTVDIAQDVELMTRAQWDNLTTAQKQAKGLVGIQDAQSGFERGILVNGADYIPINALLPYSAESSVKCSAKAVDYVSHSLIWGLGTVPVQMSATDAVYNSTTNAVYIPAATSGSNTYAYLTQPESEDDTETVFTVYMVLKNHSTASGARLFVTGGYNANWDLIITRQANGNAYFGSWGTDTDTGVSSDDFFVCAIKWDGTLSSDKGACIIYDATNDTMVKMVASPAELSSTSITFGTNLGSYRQNGDISAKFIGMVNVFETDTVIENNIRSLYNEFIAE